jgi:hypothetical protein
VALGARPRAVAILAALGAVVGAAPVPAAAQAIDAVPDRVSATVGDSVVLRLTVRLGTPDAALMTWVPEAEGVLLTRMDVSADSVVKTGPGTFEGRAVVVFFRPGRQTVPSFALTYRRGVMTLGAIVRSEPVKVEVKPTLTAGGQQLKEIRGLVAPPGPGLLPYVAALALVAAAGTLVARRRRYGPEPTPVAAPAAPSPPPPTPYQVAAGRLSAIAAERWPSRGEVARHYEEAADVLRRYLEDAAQVPARELTTSALLRSLPGHLADGGLRGRCRALLAEADLVKFARVRPSEAEASLFLARARELLDRWHEVSRPAPAASLEARGPEVAQDAEEPLDAVR